MNDKGYVLGNRYQIMNWLRNVASPENLDISKTVSKSFEELKAKADAYEEPLHVDGDFKYEKNVKVVAKCENKHCSLCEQYDLNKCLTCEGRFGDQSSKG